MEMWCPCGGIAGIGLGHLLGREHASAPQGESGVEAPRLLKNGASLDCVVAVVVSDTASSVCMPTPESLCSAATDANLPVTEHLGV